MAQIEESQKPKEGEHSKVKPSEVYNNEKQILDEDDNLKPSEYLRQIETSAHPRARLAQLKTDLQDTEVHENGDEEYKQKVKNTLEEVMTLLEKLIE